MSTDPDRLGLTRIRDLAAVAAIAAVVGYLLVRFNYDRWPALPALVYLPPLAIGIAALVAARLVYRRIHGAGDRLPPLVVARVLALAKAGALAAAALGGFWLGALGYLWPESRLVVAAAADRTTGLWSVAGAAVMLVGALVLERATRTPAPPDQDAPSDLRK